MERIIDKHMNSFMNNATVLVEQMNQEGDS